MGQLEFLEARVQKAPVAQTASQTHEPRSAGLLDGCVRLRPARLIPTDTCVSPCCCARICTCRAHGGWAQITGILTRTACVRRYHTGQMQQKMGAHPCTLHVQTQTRDTLHRGQKLSCCQ